MSSHSLPPGSLPSREELARLEVGHTSVRRGGALSLVFAFLALLLTPLLVDTTVRAAGGPEASTAWPQLQRLPAEVLARLGAAHEPLLRRIVAANRAVLAGLHGFEDALEDEAVPARALRPPAQYLLTAFLGVGNERAYKGLDGWLFYRPDVEYVTGHGFLDPAQMARRIASTDEWIARPRPDAREAIVQFHHQLQARGIALVVVPTPVKPSVHPERLVRGVTAPVHNASYPEFVADLERRGIAVFDVWKALRAGASSAEPLYLDTDTHWRPRAMERVASALADVVRERGSLPAVPHPGYTWQRQRATQTGDIAVMLDLPDPGVLYPPETVEVRRVVGPDGAPWRPERNADVLVLGDSFSNIYSLASMGWGDAGGFVEHLSLALGRPVDRIVQNDEGAFATRARLRQEMAAGMDRLEGKRVVIYQFATRELAAGDWRLIDLPPPAPR